MLEYISIIITAIFVNNIVFAQFLGICPFIGVSRKLSSAVGMGAAVTFVMALATTVAWLLQEFVLVPFGLGFMQTIVFILVIAALVQMLEIILKKIAPALYSALGVFLPLITTNCAVLGVAIEVTRKGYNLGESVVYAVAIAIGFTMASRPAQMRAMGTPRIALGTEASWSCSRMPANIEMAMVKPMAIATA